MVEVVGVRFKAVGKIYYFAPKDKKVKNGDKVIVETTRGLEFGEVVLTGRMVDESTLGTPLSNVVRVATAEDIEKNKQNKQKRLVAFESCLKKIKKHNLKMRLVEVEYTFDGSKILFYFTADGRIDFRELVKDLAAEFKVRIELRQIGIRDEAKMMGGMGVCGRVLCCKEYLDEFQPVSIRMAKEQGLSLNPTKISGRCGRLMCCLKYEQEAYEDLNSRVPRVGAIVDTEDGQGEVIYVSLLKEIVKVKLEDKDDNTLEVREYPVKDIKVIKNARSSYYLSDEDIDMDEIKELED
ncbi:MAG: stage 0 sporulation family protein [Clostridiales bacterium]|nr:stage 0 sporulation family protein [Clostridiales bacterium]